MRWRRTSTGTGGLDLVEEDEDGGEVEEIADEPKDVHGAVRVKSRAT